MTEPLSFVASVVAIASLAGTVGTKGYTYIKAVKDCPHEVRSLVAEVNVLWQGVENDTNATLSIESGVGEEREEETGQESRPSAATSISLTPPNFVLECQKTLFEIEAVLSKFYRAAAQSTASSAKVSKYTVASLRRMQVKDLKWPLHKSRTMQLIEALERHKTTCTLALAESSLAGVHAILEQTKISNSYLADIKAKQEKIFELTITNEQERVLALLTSVDPIIKLRAFRNERQRGTGLWLFDLPEMVDWLNDSPHALWIYGIPGARKTILSTVVVDKVLTRKRSTTVGTAYFYITHDDQKTLLLSNVPGSIIHQLARQNSSALAEVVATRKRLLVAPTFDDHELHKLLYRVLRQFEDAFILVDGLDECGSIFDHERKQLLDFVATLCDHKECPIHLLVLSRDEQDIRNNFDAAGFHFVSIAATSADLRIYVNAWLTSLEVQSESLKIEIIDTLVEEANGMFMWVRAQVDYLQRLPNDLEKRKALKKLPPDLPQTYIRIFETIDRMYPPETTKYIRFALKWLVQGERGRPLPYDNSWWECDDSSHLMYRTFGSLICLEPNSALLSAAMMPTRQQVLRWLGCLVQETSCGHSITLSHFTVKEFLDISPEDMPSPGVRSYLVTPLDRIYLLNSILTYIAHKAFEIQGSLTLDKVLEFLESDCLFEYAAGSLYGGGSRTVSAFPASFCSNNGFDGYNTEPSGHGCEPDEANSSVKGALSALHLAIIGGYGEVFYVHRGTLKKYRHPYDEDRHVSSKQKLGAVRALVDSGADLNRQLRVARYTVFWHEDLYFATVTPLVLALALGFTEAVRLLLDKGANWKAVANEDLEAKGGLDLCSIEAFLNETMMSPERLVDLDWILDSLQRIVDTSRHRELGKMVGKSASI